MATKIFLGEPPANIKQWIIDHSGPAGHADTWYKYEGDTEWRTVSIQGTIQGSYNEEDDIWYHTNQIEGIDSVVSLEIGTSVTSIGMSAFKNCENIRSITIPNSVTSIGQSAFESCYGLTELTIPDSVTSIGFLAFYSSGLTSVTIPNSVMSIGDNAFQSCVNLTSVIVSNSVTSIGYAAFDGDDSLTSITFLGKTIAEVQAMANYSWEISDTSIINVA